MKRIALAASLAILAPFGVSGQTSDQLGREPINSWGWRTSIVVRSADSIRASREV